MRENRSKSAPSRQHRFCVQVKSEHGSVDRPTLDQPRGAMPRAKIERSRQNDGRQNTRTIFDVYLWDEQKFITQLLTVYEKLNAELRAGLPLKRVSILASTWFAPHQVDNAKKPH